MKYVLKKLLSEEIDIVLDAPMYVSYLNGLYYRFVPLSDGRVEVTNIYINGDKFDISVRHIFFETDFQAYSLGEGYKEISPDEFYGITNDLMSKANLIPIYNYQTP